MNKILVKRSKQEYENQEKKANEAANKLQSVFRGHLGRNKAKNKQIQEIGNKISAKILQRAYRGHLVKMNIIKKKKHKKIKHL